MQPGAVAASVIVGSSGTRPRGVRPKAVVEPHKTKASLNSQNSGGRDRHRSGDLALFRRALYQLSYPTVGPGTDDIRT